VSDYLKRLTVNMAGGTAGDPGREALYVSGVTCGV